MLQGFCKLPAGAKREYPCSALYSSLQVHGSGALFTFTTKHAITGRGIYAEHNRLMA